MATPLVGLIIGVIGLATFGLRLSLIALWQRLRVPEAVERALAFIPPAVLAAIIAPELAYNAEGALALSLGNERLLAGLIAAAVAWRTENMLLTLVVGMGTLWGLQALL